MAEANPRATRRPPIRIAVAGPMVRQPRKLTSEGPASSFKPVHRGPSDRLEERITTLIGKLWCLPFRFTLT